MLVKFESVLFVLIITTLFQIKQAKPIQKEDQSVSSTYDNIESEKEELNQLLKIVNSLKFILTEDENGNMIMTSDKKTILDELIKKYIQNKFDLLENEESKSGSVDPTNDYPIKKSFKKSWNLPIESLKWYSQNSAKSNAPQEMYDQLVGAFHNTK